MKNPTQKMLALLAIASVCLSANVQAQDGERRRGNFDPAQFQQMMMDRIREQMEVKDDTEWKAIQSRIQKVMDARREVGVPGMGMMMGFGRRGGGPGGPGGPTGGGESGGDRRRSPFGEPSAEAQALQRAIEAKASAAELKTALEKYRAAQKQKQENLEKAQADLQKVLSVQQEATAVMMGLLN